MHTLQRPHEGAGLYERLTRWRLPLTLLCLTVAVLAFLWALPGGLFRAAVASSQNSTTPRTKPIEQIVPGDLVLARDPESGETRAKQVLRVFRNVSDHLRLLTVRNADGTSQVLRTTDGHPFWVPDRGWTAAAELKVGDNLVQADGQPATLVATAYEAHPEGVPIFNFEVEGFHTYFVTQKEGGSAIWVHNVSRAYGDGTPSSFTGSKSPRLPESVEPGPPHTRLIWDDTPAGPRVYRARTYNSQGERVRDFDFAGRPGSEQFPHFHDWLPNPTGGSKMRGPAVPFDPKVAPPDPPGL